MNEGIYRKKSTDKLKSPETLDDYIRVSNPGVWLLLVSVVILLAGACVWGMFGRIDSTVPASVRVENGEAVCYIAEQNAFSVSTGMTVRFSGVEVTLAQIGEKDGQQYVCRLQWQGASDVPDGVYEGKVVVKSYRPISFILN